MVNLPLVLVEFFAAAVAAVLGILSWRRREVAGTGAVLFTAFMAAVVWGAVLSGFANGTTDITANLLFKAFTGVAFNHLGVLWLALVLHYTGHDRWMTWRRAALLALPGTAFVFVTVTNALGLHYLFWASAEVVESGPFRLATKKYGPAFAPYLIYLNGLLWFADGLLIRAVLRTSGIYRRQAAALLAGALISTVIGFLTVFSSAGIVPLPTIEYSHVGLALGGVIWAWGLFRFRLMDIVPVAHEAVLASLQDGVIVLDSQSRVVDLNPAAERITRRTAAEAIGQPAETVFAERPDLLERFLRAESAQAEIVLGRGGPDGERTFDLRISPLRDRRARLTGRTIVLRDVSERKRVEGLERALLQAELTHASAIQRRLLPTALPQWPGRLELAVRFLPARETSGDFYDVLPLPGSVASASASAGDADADAPALQIAVGDVAGKGIAAALVMAVARTTLRAIAQPSIAIAPTRPARPTRPTRPTRSATPSAAPGILTLPAAASAAVAAVAAVAVPSPASVARQTSLLLHRDVGRRDFVACAIAVLEPIPTSDPPHNGAPAAVARLRLTNAAQVPPLLCRAGSATELVPPGDSLPLGVAEHPEYSDLALDLFPGDTLVFSSDGLPEAPASDALAIRSAPDTASDGTDRSHPFVITPPSEPRELFGFPRLAASAAFWAARSPDAEAVAAGIWADVTAWCGDASGHDDMTLLVLRIPAAVPVSPHGARSTGPNPGPNPGA